MNLESKHANAIKHFLDSIGYKEWHSHILGVVAISVHNTEEDMHLGTFNFRNLANSINYLDCLERTT